MRDIIRAVTPMATERTCGCEANPCGRCVGKTEAQEPEKCETCGGSRTVYHGQATREPVDYRRLRCPDCAEIKEGE